MERWEFWNICLDSCVEMLKVLVENISRIGSWTLLNLKELVKVLLWKALKLWMCQYYYANLSLQLQRNDVSPTWYCRWFCGTEFPFWASLSLYEVDSWSATSVLCQSVLKRWHCGISIQEAHVHNYQKKHHWSLFIDMRSWNTSGKIPYVIRRWDKVTMLLINHTDQDGQWVPNV